MTQISVLKNKDEAKQLAKSVMDLVAKGELEQGILLTKLYLRTLDYEFDGMLNNFRMQNSLIYQTFGNTLSAELITVEEVGESLMLIMYLHKFEKHTMRWQFYFYKPYDSWILNSFFSDDKVAMMLTKM